ncbi:MAG: hypothetical protein HFJ93_01875 [Muribaculaceae bacterium]|jgi:hypothetical protein|nr:hypothetical protein [Muribaculaceae bacterium]
MRITKTIKRYLKKSLHGLWLNLYYKPWWMTRMVAHPGRYAVHDSYYPELKRKSILRIWLEQMEQIVRYGTPNEFYFPYGFDVKGRAEMETYLHYDPFMQQRDALNIRPHSATAVLRDKMLFGMFAGYLGVATPDNVGVTSGRDVFVPSTQSVVATDDFLAALSDGDYFVKPADGECGAGIFRIRKSGVDFEMDDTPASVDEISARLRAERYLIQRTVEQHNVLSAIHPQSLNTMRLVTVRDLSGDAGIVVFPSILRVGTGGSSVDNTSRGGLAIGIDLATGRLRPHGYYKPTYGTRTELHPDSGVRFADVTIPFFEEAKAQAIRLHSMLPGIHSIGWDIAVGPDGPVFVEGNDNWEINGPQICNGGLRDLFNHYAGKQ